MTKDASLDQYGSSTAERGAEVEAADGSTAFEAPEDGERDDSETDAPEVSPAVSTYEWSPAGGDCADCGRTVERRWRADGEREGDLVCENCKEWGRSD